MEDSLRTCMIDFKGNWDDHISLMISLTTTVTIRAIKLLHIKLFMGEDADVLLGGSKFLKHGL